MVSVAVYHAVHQNKSANQLYHIHHNSQKKKTNQTADAKSKTNYY